MAAAEGGAVSQLLSRVLVTIVALPAVLWFVYLGGWPLFALALVVALLALHELYVMARSLRPLVPAGYAGALAALLGAQLGGAVWRGGGFMLTLLLAFALFGVAETRQSGTITMSVTVLGAAWIGLGLGHLLLLRDLPEHGRLAVFTVLLAIFADDTAAYFVGRLLGRHKLAPSISPGKTWEGFLAGTIVAVAVVFFAIYDQDFLTIWESLVLGGGLALAGAAGDLFESALKRDLQVKDSGRLLGGHGGMLDRIDAHLFAAVAAFYIILALG
ncbi:phosphatidate cytidylyltransferase [soil metagenome]